MFEGRAYRQTGHGLRTIRFADGDGGVATTTYSYKLTAEEREVMARRITAALNLVRNMTIEQIEWIAALAPPRKYTNVEVVAATSQLTRCAAARDGECSHPQCPQTLDGEPVRSGRHCPIDQRHYWFKPPPSGGLRIWAGWVQPRPNSLDAGSRSGGLADHFCTAGVMMTERIDGWSVTVSVNAEDVLTIGNDHMGGSGSIGEFAPIMRTCAAHLLSFIGEGSDYAGNHVALAHATGDHSRDSVELEALRELRRTVEYQIAHGNGTLAIEAALERVQALKSQQRGNHAVRDATIEECSAICQRHASTTLSDPAMHAASRTAAHPVLVRAAVEIVGLKLERK